MRVIYAGYRKWSYNILKKLVLYHTPLWKIVGCITTPDAEVTFDSFRIPCFVENPKELSNPTILKEILSRKPDIFLFYGWSWMIPKELYNKFPCIVLHPSPLPKYRGGSPLQNQIIRGEEESAVTLFQVDNRIDHGPIYAQKEISLTGTLNEIIHRIVRTGTALTIKVLDDLANKKLVPVAQDESQATEFKRRTSKESEITVKDFQNKTAKELYNFIRSLTAPYPNAYFICKDGKKIFFKEISLEHE